MGASVLPDSSAPFQSRMKSVAPGYSFQSGKKRSTSVARPHHGSHKLATESRRRLGGRNHTGEMERSRTKVARNGRTELAHSRTRQLVARSHRQEVARSRTEAHSHRLEQVRSSYRQVA